MDNIFLINPKIIKEVKISDFTDTVIDYSIEKIDVTKHAIKISLFEKFIRFIINKPFVQPQQKLENKIRVRALGNVCTFDEEHFYKDNIGSILSTMRNNRSFYSFYYDKKSEQFKMHSVISITDNNGYTKHYHFLPLDFEQAKIHTIKKLEFLNISHSIN